MASLPDYVASAQPIPSSARSAWYKNTAQTYAGIMLWFVFWQDIVAGSGTFGGSLSAGIGVALLGLVIAALFCHFLTYLVPGLLGMKTGLPLYVVGTSTYGVHGGLLMPGFFMGCLQFGWLAVNGFFTCYLICKCFGIGLNEAGDVAVPGPIHGTMTAVFILLAVGVGLKGIQYVAKVATFMPLIPLVILLILLAKTCGGLSEFSTEKIIDASKQGSAKKVEDADEAAAKAEDKLAAAKDDKAKLKKEADDAKKAASAARSSHLAKTRTPLSAVNVLLFLSLLVVGFFATAGAAGVDFGMNNRNASDVQLGGAVGIIGATVFAGGAAILIVAGAYGGGMVENVGQLNAVELMPDIMGGEALLGLKPADWMLLLLAISAFAPACFPAFIAANSFRTTMPKFGMPAVGIGTACAILLAVTGWAGQAVAVFTVIGASFGPICGAMMADYLSAGSKWAGPRAGFNPAGWISWAVGFAVGAFDLIAKTFSEVPDEYVSVIPCPPMAALVVGFLLYLILAKAGMESEQLEMPSTTK